MWAFVAVILQNLRVKRAIDFSQSDFVKHEALHQLRNYNGNLDKRWCTGKDSVDHEKVYIMMLTCYGDNLRILLRLSCWKAFCYLSVLTAAGAGGDRHFPSAPQRSLHNWSWFGFCHSLWFNCNFWQNTVWSDEFMSVSFLSFRQPLFPFVSVQICCQR